MLLYKISFEILCSVGVARVGVTRGGNHRAPTFFDIFKMKIFASFSLFTQEN